MESKILWIHILYTIKKMLMSQKGGILEIIKNQDTWWMLITTHSHKDSVPHSTEHKDNPMFAFGCCD